MRCRSFSCEAMSRRENSCCMARRRFSWKNPPLVEAEDHAAYAQQGQRLEPPVCQAGTTITGEAGPGFIPHAVVVCRP